MALKAEERLPGVTFHLESATQGPSSTHKAIGRVHLTADIDDFDLWDETVKRLSKLRIYDSDSFQNDMLELLQEDGEKLTSELARVKEGHRSEKARLEAEVAHYQRLANGTMIQNAQMAKRLAELEEWKAQLDALSGS